MSKSIFPQRRRWLIIPVVTAALATAACTAAPAATAGRPSTPTLPPPSSSTSTAATPATSTRGMLVKALGEEAGIGSDPAHALVTFTIDSITPAHCDAPYYDEKPNGTLMAAHMRLTTAPGIDMTQTGLGAGINPLNFEFVDPNGITHAGQEIVSIATYGCEKDSEVFPDIALSPGSSYVGDLVFDLPATHGALIFDAGLSNASGWEWDF